MKTHYHFIGNAATGDDVAKLCSLTWEEGIVACCQHTWVWPVYCQLKMRNWPVSFGYELHEGSVNIIHGQVARECLTANDLRSHFIVAIRADFRPFPFGQFEVVQNQQYADAGRQRVYMPHLPQPGLIPRDRNRAVVVNVCFSGQVENSIDTHVLERDLEQLGCRLVFRELGQWQDMREVDILFGIRSFSKKQFHSKPPSKLFNAWLAGIPFIGGYDSAYEQVGQPGYDYLRVSDYDGLIRAIVRLKDEPDFYREIVAHGAKAGAQYTPARITEKWENFLEDVVKPHYFDWLSRKRFSFRPIMFSVGKKGGCWPLADWF